MTAEDLAALKRLYSNAVSVAGTLWDSADLDGEPDASLALKTIDGLAEALAENRTALVALTTVKNGEHTMFTHMVNVAILTMMQADGLGIEGTMLRELGLAALMHDIGKVRTPEEILNKPDKLSENEFEIMKRHTIDGAKILDATPDIPALAPTVAYEHHLRLDGSGYPDKPARTSLNTGLSIGTMLCSIADVYDAMRSERRYQQSVSTDRVLAVLTRNDGQHFDRHLVDRFIRLVGIYPVGSLVRLNTGDTAVVVKTYAFDLLRPRVRIVLDRDGQPLAHPLVVNLWETTDRDGPSSIVASVDPTDCSFDPLAFI